MKQNSKTITIIIVALAALGLALWSPWNGSLAPETVLAKTNEAIEALQSCRFELSASYPSNPYTPEYSQKGDFSSPDRYYVQIDESGDNTEEFIAIGDDIYVKNTYMSKAVILAMTKGISGLLQKETTLGYLTIMTDIEELPEERIDGVMTIHYQGKWDIEQLIEKSKRSMQEARDALGHEQPTDEEIDQSLDIMRSTNYIIDLWTGKDDYLPRQMILEQYEKNGESWDHISTSSFRLYDFNEPITIEPPVSEDGQFLEGWRPADSRVSAPNQDVFTKNCISTIGFQDGYNDMGHQEVHYTISITNQSVETVKNVKVTITTMLTDENNKPVTIDAVPETSVDSMSPGESMAFTARLPFNGTAYTKVEILKMLDMTTVLVHFTTEDEQQLTEPFPSKIPQSTQPS